MLTYFCMLNVKRKTAVFAYKYSKCLDVCAFAHSHPKSEVVVQPKKTRPDITEKVLNQIKQINRNFCQCDQCSDILLRLRSIKLIFLFLDRNICCGYSKEPSQ